MGKGIDDDIAAVCNPEQVDEDWAKIMALCDRMMVGDDKLALDAIQSLSKRLRDKNPRTVNFAITMTNAGVENAGRNFRLAVCSRDFMAAVEQVLDPKNASKMDAKVRRRLAGLMLSWQNAFGNDPQLSLVRTTIQKLRTMGTEFDESQATAGLPAAPVSSAVAPASTSLSAAELARKEEEDVKRAIAASLQDAAPRARSSNSTSNAAPASSGSLYPSLGGGSGAPTSSTTFSATSAPAATAAKQARVLYDFDANEPNELSLRAGSMVRVLDDADSNWWKGENSSGDQGYFPAAFVSYDLSVKAPQPAPVAESSPAVVGNATNGTAGGGAANGQYGAGALDAVNDSHYSESSGTPEATLPAPAKFDQLLELLEAEVAGDESRRAERESLEKECEGALPQLQERVEGIDDSLDRMTKLVDKYSLVMTLCTRLLAQQPARARPTMATPRTGPNGPAGPSGPGHVDPRYAGPAGPYANAQIPPAAQPHMAPQQPYTYPPHQQQPPPPPPQQQQQQQPPSASPAYSQPAAAHPGYSALPAGSSMPYQAMNTPPPGAYGQSPQPPSQPQPPASHQQHFAPHSQQPGPAGGYPGQMQSPPPQAGYGVPASGPGGPQYAGSPAPYNHQPMTRY